MNKSYADTLESYLIDPVEEGFRNIDKESTNTIVNLIMKIMNSIEYGCFDKNGKELDIKDIWYSYVQSPQDTLKHKKGMCLDQVELEKFLFDKKSIKYKTFYVEYTDEDGDHPSHVFLTFKDNKKYYWFEHSWNSCRGIKKYDSLKELLNDVAVKHCKEYIKTCRICEYKEKLCHKGQQEIINLMSHKQNLYKK